MATGRFSRWLLHAVPMPRGAREWHHSPTAHYRTGTVGIGPSDPAFTRTTWWTMPLSSGAFASWLRLHAPRRLRADSASGGPVESGGVWEQERDFTASGTAAHTQGWVSFSFMPYGEGVVVRVDTFAGARFARTVLVPDDATAVTIRRTERSLGPHARPHKSVRRITRTTAVSRLVTMVNRLPGAMTAPFVASCPAIVTQVSYSMSFATPQGRYAAVLRSPGCWGQVMLRHDGVRAGPRLDPGRVFTAVADQYLRR